MTRRIVVLAVAALTLGVGDAVAETTIACGSCSRPYQQWVDEAKVPTPDVTLSVVEEACPGLVDDFAWACTELNSFTIWTAARFRPRTTFLHELGHNFDYYMLPDWGRERFRRLTHNASDWKAEPNGPKEKFAEAYARCAVTGHHFQGDPNLGINGNGGLIRQSIYRAICRLIISVGS